MEPQAILQLMLSLVSLYNDLSGLVQQLIAAVRGDGTMSALQMTEALRDADRRRDQLINDIFAAGKV